MLRFTRRFEGGQLDDGWDHDDHSNRDGQNGEKTWDVALFAEVIHEEGGRQSPVLQGTYQSAATRAADAELPLNGGDLEPANMYYVTRLGTSRMNKYVLCHEFW